MNRLSAKIPRWLDGDGLPREHGIKPPSLDELVRVCIRVRSVMDAARVGASLDPRFIPVPDQVEPVPAATPELAFHLGAAVGYLQRKWCGANRNPQFSQVLGKGIRITAEVVGALSRIPCPETDADPTNRAEGWVRDGQVDVHATKPDGSPVVVDPKASPGGSDSEYRRSRTHGTVLAMHLLALVRQMERVGFGPPQAGGASLQGK